MATTQVSRSGARLAAVSRGARRWHRLRRHWLILALVALGAAVRGLTMAAYTPALLFHDSWGYIAAAYSGNSFALPSLHPFGYPVLLWLLSLPGRSLAELVAFQHLAALTVGVAIYATLLRARLPRWAAAAAAALVLLDGYSITLEQYVMSDTFFTATLLLAVLVLVWPRLRVGRRGSGPAAAVWWAAARCPACCWRWRR